MEGFNAKELLKITRAALHQEDDRRARRRDAWATKAKERALDGFNAMSVEGAFVDEVDFDWLVEQGFRLTRYMGVEAEMLHISWLH